MEWLPLCMFITLLVFIFTGYPVAFSLGGTAVLYALGGLIFDVFELPRLTSITSRLTGVMSNQILLAVPYFIFMGTMLEKSKLAENLLKTVGQLFGPVRGGVAIAVVLVGALLAAATGVVGASVVAMGLFSLPVMLQYGYKKEFATGVIAASGTLGQIIPPSVVLVVLADQVGVSLTYLFQGAFTPGIMLAGMFTMYVIIISTFRKDVAPALPPDQREKNMGKLALRVVFVLLPPLLLILVVLGSIFFGVASPTEAGALGAVGAIILAAASKHLNKTNLYETMETTMRLTCMVLYLLIGSIAFTTVFHLFGGQEWIEHLLGNLPGGLVGALIVANLAIFILGFFIDFFEIAFIVVPLLVPAFKAMMRNNPEAFSAMFGETVLMDGGVLFFVWFGVMIAMNLQTSFLTPPFGFALFYLKGVCPEEVKTTHIYKGIIPFIIIQLTGLALVVKYPELVTWMIDLDAGP